MYSALFAFVNGILDWTKEGLLSICMNKLFFIIETRNYIKSFCVMITAVNRKMICEAPGSNNILHGRNAYIYIYIDKKYVYGVTLTY